MYPSQTSLIPATVALVRFFLEKGPEVFLQNYPYWYLGSTPFRYLIGPVTPILYFVVRFIFPYVSLFSISIYFVILFSILSGVGWLILVNKISGIPLKTRSLKWYFILFLLFPWKYLSGLAFDEVSFFVARSLVPFVLVFIWNYLSYKNSRNLVLASLAVTFLLLIHTNVIVSLIVGTVALVLTLSFKDGKIKKFDKKLKRFALPLLFGLLLSALWYGPGFWLAILNNPGIGGASGIKVILGILDFAKNILPLVLAVIIVRFGVKFKDRLSVFSWIWLGSFLILILFRFLANPEFWADWTSWIFEAETGLWLVAVVNFRSISKFSIFLFPSVITTILVYLALGKPMLISTEPPEITSILPKLVELAGKERVFVSGSNTFWLNAFYNTVQVRGGRDEVAIDPNWRAAAFNFREGLDSITIEKDLRKLNINYVLVNTNTSNDYYKDFKNTDKWGLVAQVVASGSGDLIYKVK